MTVSPYSGQLVLWVFVLGFTFLGMAAVNRSAFAGATGLALFALALLFPRWLMS